MCARVCVCAICLWCKWNCANAIPTNPRSFVRLQIQCVWWMPLSARHIRIRKEEREKTRTNRSRYSIWRIFNTYRSSTSFLFHHITVDWTIVFNIFLLLFIFFLPSSCVLLLASMQAIAITSCCFNFTCFFLHFSQSHSLPLPVPHARLISFSQK